MTVHKLQGRTYVNGLVRPLEMQLLRGLRTGFRLECEKQLEYMSIEIAKEMQENGVLK